MLYLESVQIDLFVIMFKLTYLRLFIDISAY